MRGELIALDLETTGLDPNQDQIIEVGLALCKDDQIIDKFQTLVNPVIPIPPAVVSLTGITNNDVKNAPLIDEILPQMVQFIGNRPIVAHNISFDIGMLEKHRVAQTNLRLDTFDLATILLPTSPRYNLNTLVETFNLQLNNAHRAFDDAVAGWQVYRQLWQRLFDLPLSLLEEIVENSEGIFWPVGVVLKDALALRHERGETSPGRMVFDFKPDSTAWTPLEPKSPPTSLNIDALSADFQESGKLAHHLAHYQVREGQIQMTRHIAAAFNTSTHLMVEAPIGTGKALAYLLPAAQWAIENNERIILAAATPRRREELLNREIPFLQNALGMPIQTAAIKHRNEYLSPRKLAALRRHKATTIDELRMLAKVLVWLHQGGRGERSELNLRGADERGAWQRISEYDSWHEPEVGSPFYEAQQRAKAAHLLVVAHDLLLSHEADVIPDYRYIIVDEAHLLEENLTYGLKEMVDRVGLLDSLANMGNINKGLLRNILVDLDSLPDKAYQKMETYFQDMADAGKQMKKLVERFFDRILQSAFRDEESSPFTRQIRITDETRKHDTWNDVRAAWDDLKDYLDTLSASLDKIVNALGQLVARYDIQNYEDMVESIQSASSKLKLSHLFLERFVNAPAKNTIYWVLYSSSFNNQVELSTAPLRVGGLLQKNLWEAKKSAILTSATLRTLQTFDFFIDRLNTGTMKTAIMPARFQHKDNTLIFLPTDIPEPNQRVPYREMVERAIIELATVTEGKMLCLFTSFQQLRETSQNTAPRLALGNIMVYDEAHAITRDSMSDGFNTTEKAVLMGTFSHWENLDEQLQVIVMIRLPFSPPTDAIFAARSESYGDNSFKGYMIPDAIIQFRQGFDQLNRQENAKGLVVILDKRMTSKPYGQHFIDSLPEVKVQRGVIANLPKIAKEWLKK